MVQATPPDAQLQRTEFRTKLAFIAILCSVCTTALETTAISVALPAISIYFDVSATNATWVVAMSQFVIVALLLPMASLGEIVGYRRVFLVSLSIFSVATLACVLAPTFPALVAARAVQAIGSAGVMSLGFALARTVYSDRKLGAAIGIMAATVAVTSSFGPAISGFILITFDWRGVFGLMLAFSLIALTMGTLALPTSQPSGKPYDLPGAALVALTFAAALCCFNGVANDWPVMTLGGAGVVFVVGSIAIFRRSRGTASPVFPLDLFRRPAFSLSVGASICAFIAQSIGFILLPFYLIYGAGMGALEMALTLSVWPAATAILAPILGRFSGRIPAGPAGAVGLSILAIGFISLTFLSKDASAVEIAFRFAACGMGFALFQTPNNRMILLSAPRERSGAASGSLSLARQFGRAAGIAFAAYILSDGAQSGSLDAMKFGAGIAGFGAIVSLARTWLPKTT